MARGAEPGANTKEEFALDDTTRIAEGVAADSTAEGAAAESPAMLVAVPNDPERLARLACGGTMCSEGDACDSLARSWLLVLPLLDVLPGSALVTLARCVAEPAVDGSVGLGESDERESGDVEARCAVLDERELWPLLVLSVEVRLVFVSPFAESARDISPVEALREPAEAFSKASMPEVGSCTIEIAERKETGPRKASCVAGICVPGSWTGKGPGILLTDNEPSSCRPLSSKIAREGATNSTVATAARAGLESLPAVEVSDVELGCAGSRRAGRRRAHWRQHVLPLRNETNAALRSSVSCGRASSAA